MTFLVAVLMARAYLESREWYLREQDSQVRAKMLFVALRKRGWSVHRKWRVSTPLDEE